VEVPEPLRRLVNAWRSAGSPAQPGIAWPRKSWAARFPAWADTFAVLPDRLSRPAVRLFSRSAATDPQAALRAFLVTMTWGYGRLGYGPFRVQRILATTPETGERLQQAARELLDHGPVQAYRRLGDHGIGQLPFLGPAFGTKFLYFCSPPGPGALILDRLVADWLRAQAGLSLSQVRWSSQTYDRYLATMSGWAGQLSVTADELETCIFSDQARLVASQWTSKP
jgi:hypothetical protein